MARFVLIKEICSTSWLVWTVRSGGSCLRDYRTSPAKQHRQYSTKQIENWLENDGNYREDAPYKSVKDADFWREQQWLRNVESSLQKVTAADRLLNTFKKKMKVLLNQGDVQELRYEMDRWKRGFDRIVTKKQFNHWDNDDATSKQCLDKGIGWSASMLERSRDGGHSFYISTGEIHLDFALVAMELGLGISSKNNAFQPGKKDFIKPDGLGLRRDGTFCIVEVKGPKDDGDLLEATLQGVCGALAVYSKRAMIVRLARTFGGRRPRVLVRAIPQQRPTLGVYVLVSAKHLRGRPMFPWEGQPKTYCDLILQGFRQLREIVFFSVEPEQCSDFRRIVRFACEHSQLQNQRCVHFRRYVSYER
jgi:hypothetical protein